MASANENHLSWGAARDGSRVFDGTCLFAHGERSTCAHCVRTQQSFCRNMSFCARKQIQVCLWRAKSAVLSHAHVFLLHVFLLAHRETSKCARSMRTQQSFRWNMSFCARSEIQVCSRRGNATFLYCGLFAGTCLFAHGVRSKFAHSVRRQQSSPMNRSSAGTCFFPHGERSKCAHSARMQQCFHMNMSVCARREIQVCSWRENAAIFSPEHAFLHTE